MHFDRFKKATLTPVKLYQSDGEEMPERSTESDSNFEQVAPRTRNVPYQVRVVEGAAASHTADAQVKQADKPASPKHQAMATVASSNCIWNSQSINSQAPVPNTAVKAPADPDLAVAADAKATYGVAAVSADANGPRRVSARTTKGQAPRRYSSRFVFQTKR